MLITTIEVITFLAIIIFPVVVPINKKQRVTKNDLVKKGSAYAVNQQGKLERLNDVQYND